MEDCYFFGAIIPSSWVCNTTDKSRILYHVCSSELH